MAPILTRRKLVSVASMGLIHFLSAKQPAQQRQRRINDKNAQKNQPAPKKLWRNPCRLQRHKPKHDTEVAASRIPHENLRWGKVPNKEPGHRTSNCCRQPDILVHSGYPVQQSSAQADEDRFDTGKPVDTVHEIV
ncbi:hypothetical protein D9M71_739960 [compost metagenome]